MDDRSRMDRGNPSEWDVMRADGRRSVLIVLVDHGLSLPDGYYLPEVFEYLDGWTIEDEGSYGEAAWNLWLDISRTHKQCRLLMALAPTAERAERILDQHRKNLHVLYIELRGLCEKAGWVFAVKGDPR
jgi:hypothetical protein